MKKIFLSLMLALASISIYAANPLNGKFTVNAGGKQVQFSQSNLMYSTSGTHETASGIDAKGQFSFYSHQYDMVGSRNMTIGETNEDYIDLFGWGTSGYNGREPWLNTSHDLDYGNPDNNTKSDIAGTFYDWGVCNAIANDDEPGLWRVLTAAEWKYLFAQRDNAAALRSKATVADVQGLILLPDDWDLTAKPLAATLSNYTDVTISAGDWSGWEKAGAVFLPTAGVRNPNLDSYSANSFTYATGTYSDSYEDYRMCSIFDMTYATTADGIGSADYMVGSAVRLVKDVIRYYAVTIETEHCDVTVSPSNINLDAVEEGTILTLTAVPTDPYRFKEWENYNPATGLVVTSDTTVTARCALLWQVTLPECEHGHVEVTYTATGVALTAEEMAAIPHGTQVHFKAVPDDGYKFKNWNFTTGGTDIDITINQDREVSATFIDINTTWKVAYTLDIPGAATVTCVTPGIDLNAVPDGAEITLTWIPAEGYRFRGMSGTMSGEITFSTESAITLKVTRNITLNLIFMQKTYTVRLQADDYSTIMPAPQREGARRAPMAFTGGRVVAYYAGTSEVAPTSVTHGTKLDIIAQPEPGWTFVQWSNTASTATTQEITITSDTTIIAYFKEETSTAIDDVQDNVQCTKVIRDGQLLIIRDGRTYNALGVEVK